MSRRRAAHFVPILSSSTNATNFVHIPLDEDIGVDNPKTAKISKPAARRRRSAWLGERELRHILVGAVVSLVFLLVLVIVLLRPVSPLATHVTPTQLSFPVIQAEYGQNCYEACKAHGRQCNAQWLRLLNDCDTLRSALGYADSVPCATAEGYDLPAYDRHFQTLHVLKQRTAYSLTCGGFHGNTARACPCGARAAATVQRAVHIVYSVEAGHYMKWQARYMHHWFAQLDWPNARLTRLLSAETCDELCVAPHSIDTHVVPPYNYTRDNYKPYNKPLGVAHWLEHGDVSADVIMVVDPDCLFNRPVDFAELVRAGRPIAQKAFFTFTRDSVEKRVIDRYAQLTNKYCGRPEPLAVPYIMLRSDLQRVAPLWLKYAEVIRADKDGWQPSWEEMPGVPWIAEMLGFVLASCELGFRTQIWPELQLVPGVNWTALGSPPAPLLHYHAPVWANNKKWAKYAADAATNYPWPLERVMPDAGPVERLFFEKMHNASKAIYNLPEKDFVWSGTIEGFKN